MTRSGFPVRPYLLEISVLPSDCKSPYTALPAGIEYTCLFFLSRTIKTNITTRKRIPAYKKKGFRVQSPPNIDKSGKQEPEQK
jgi:hypothetical protein